MKKIKEFEFKEADFYALKSVDDLRAFFAFKNFATYLDDERLMALEYFHYKDSFKGFPCILIDFNKNGLTLQKYTILSEEELNLNGAESFLQAQRKFFAGSLNLPKSYTYSLVKFIEGCQKMLPMAESVLIDFDEVGNSVTLEFFKEIVGVDDLKTPIEAEVNDEEDYSFYKQMLSYGKR